MKFRHYLESIAGVDIYPLTSLLLFFIFFTGLTIWAFRSDKRHIAYMKQIPLEDDPNQAI